MSSSTQGPLASLYVNGGADKSFSISAADGIPGILDISSASLSPGCGIGNVELPWERTGASGMGVSFVLGSGLMGIGVEAVETLRRGVGAATALGSFFLCDRVPLLVRCGTAVPGAARGVGLTGVETGWSAGAAEGFWASASKSDR